MSIEVAANRGVAPGSSPSAGVTTGTGTPTGKGGGASSGSGGGTFGLGINTSVPQTGHLACLPSVPSCVRSSFWQPVQRNSMGMSGPSSGRDGEQLSHKIADRRLCA